MNVSDCENVKECGEYEKNVKYDRAVAELRIMDVSFLSANHCKIVAFCNPSKYRMAWGHKMIHFIPLLHRKSLNFWCNLLILQHIALGLA